MIKRRKMDFVQFKVRFREALRARLEAAAKGQERSLNAEIVARLEESFARDRGREENQRLWKLLDDLEPKLREGINEFERATHRLDARAATWEALLSATDPKVAEAIREITKKVNRESRETEEQQGDKS
jgi:hypothetical protein